MLEQGLVAEQRLLDVTTIEAPADVRRRLELVEGSNVVVRRRLFLADDQPVALCHSYYPADMAAGTPIVEHRKIKGGVYAVIEDPTGPIHRQITRSVDDLVSRMPTREETEMLGLSTGVPVVRVVRTVYDSADRPVEVQDSILAADRHEFRYEVQMR